MIPARYRGRLLPGLGARLGAHPRLASAVLVLLRRVPAFRRGVLRPLLQRMAATLELPVWGGFRMLVDTTEPMGRVLATSGVWEPHVTAVFRRYLSPGDVCVDVGAYVGYYTLLAAKLVGPGGHVYALEPAREAHAALLSNVELNGLRNVTTLHVAAGAADGNARFQEEAIRSSVRDSESHPSVPVRTVGSLVPESEVARVRLVKVDVEGYEAEVVRGLEPIFDSGGRPAVLVELHAGVVEDALVLLTELGMKHGRKLYVLGDERFDEAVPWRGSPGELAHVLEPSNERHVLLAT